MRCGRSTCSPLAASSRSVASPDRRVAERQVRHLFVTQDYPPDLGGMARRHVELCRRFGDASVTMDISTVRADGAEEFDAGEPNSINRQPFSFSQAKLFTNQLRWATWLLSR